MDCVRCQKAGVFVTTKLAGDYIATLCDDCRNEWTEFILGTEEWDEWTFQDGPERVSLENRMAHEIVPVHEIKSHTERYEAARRALFSKAKEFCVPTEKDNA